jgi:hypothetical protein
MKEQGEDEQRGEERRAGMNPAPTRDGGVQGQILSRVPLPGRRKRPHPAPHRSRPYTVV